MATRTITKVIKRVTIKPKKSPNPLFIKWLKEWIDESVKNDSKLRFGYRKALISLQNYPLVLRSGKECAILHGFGPKLCARLDQRLAVYNANHTVGVKAARKPQTGTRVPKRASNQSKSPSRKKTPAVKNHVPTSHSSLPSSSLPSTSKPTLYLPPTSKPSTSLTSTSLPSTSLPSTSLPLISKPTLYLPPTSKPSTSLTSTSLPLISKPTLHVPPTSKPSTSLPSTAIPSASLPSASVKRPANTTESVTRSPTKKGRKNADIETQTFEDFILSPGSFDVILVVDNAELFGSSKARESATRQELESLDIKYEVRSLKVGDYAWVAKDVQSGNELILPYIVERKRMDDLAGSIKDGRYREQKFRLKQCGIQNLIYLIESMGKGDLHIGLPLKTLQQASINTEIHGAFYVKHVSSHRMSMEYLAAMTKILTRTFKDKVLIHCKKESLEPSSINDDLLSLMSFSEFNKAASKVRTWRVREMFIKHLIQLRGMSVEKALGIVEQYPSPRSLVAAYTASDNGAALLAKIPYGAQKRTIGPTISSAVYGLYMSKSLA